MPKGPLRKSIENAAATFGSDEGDKGWWEKMKDRAEEYTLAAIEIREGTICGELFLNTIPEAQFYTRVGFWVALDHSLGFVQADLVLFREPVDSHQVIESMIAMLSNRTTRISPRSVGAWVVQK